MRQKKIFFNFILRISLIIAFLIVGTILNHKKREREYVISPIIPYPI